METDPILPLQTYVLILGPQPKRSPFGVLESLRRGGSTAVP